MRNVPNFLTSVRIVMIPIFVYFFFIDRIDRNIASAVFLVACATDVLDGYLARKYKITSTFGAIFDPVADKLLQISALACLFNTKDLSIYVFLAIALKESLMGLGCAMLYKYNVVVPARWTGKLATVVIATSVAVVLVFGHYITSDIKDILGYLIIFFAIIAFISYCKTFIEKYVEIKNS